MSIGQALSAARRDAGLSIDDISAKTRLRATVIRAIEADDFLPVWRRLLRPRPHPHPCRTGRARPGAAAGGIRRDDRPERTTGRPTSQLYETEVSGRAITRTAQKRSPHWGLAAVGTTLVAIIIFATIGLLNHCKKTPAVAAPPGPAARSSAARRRHTHRARHPWSPRLRLRARPRASLLSRLRAPWWPKPGCTSS